MPFEKRSIKKNLILFFILTLGSLVSAQDRPYIALQKGMHIDQSYRFKKDVYRFDGGIYTPIVIEGKDILLDFSSATIIGNDLTVAPNEYQYVAIIIQNSSNVRIENLIVNNFETAIFIINSDNVAIQNCELSYNASLDNKLLPSESIRSEVPRYFLMASGVYADQVEDISITNCKISHGHHGITLKDCTNGFVKSCMVNFNTGYAVRILNGESCTIDGNLLDYNFNLWDHFIGQTGHFASGGIYLQGDCHEAEVINNSITHCSKGIDGIDLNQNDNTPITFDHNDISYCKVGLQLAHGNADIRHNHLKYNDIGILLKEMNGVNIKSNIFKHQKEAINASQVNRGSVADNLFTANRRVLTLGQAGNSRPSEINVRYNHIKGTDAPIVTDTFAQLKLEHNLLDHVTCMVEGPYHNRVQLRNNIFVSYKGDKPNRSIRRKNNFKPDDAVLKEFDTNHRAWEEADTKYLSITKLRPYPIQGLHTKINDRWGPYDFSYPWSIASRRDELSFNLLISGPYSKSWKVQRTGGLKIDVPSEGQYFDTLHLARKSLTEPVLCAFIHNGESFKDRRGHFISDYQWYYYDTGDIVWNVKSVSADENEIASLNAFDLSQLRQKLTSQDISDSDVNAIHFKTPRTLALSIAKVYLPKGIYALEMKHRPDIVAIRLNGKIIEGHFTDTKIPKALYILPSEGEVMEIQIYTFNENVQGAANISIQYVFDH